MTNTCWELLATTMYDGAANGMLDSMVNKKFLSGNDRFLMISIAYIMMISTAALSGAALADRCDKFDSYNIVCFCLLYGSVFFTILDVLGIDFMPSRFNK